MILCPKRNSQLMYHMSGVFYLYAAIEINSMSFLSITWNPSEGLDLGFYTLQYYSLMFVIAFLLGWFIMKRIFNRKECHLKSWTASLFIWYWQF